MGSFRRRVIVVMLVLIAGLTSLLGLPFVVPIVNAVARRKGPESTMMFAANR